jgi:uncharacterized membrane protein YeaQ/YmgE (transglycosylase-associated protein family)
MADVLLVLLSGFVTGALARFAVPGPDPMPAWLTILIGLAGSAIGGSVAYAIFGRDGTALSIGGFLAAIVLVILYRRFVQKRPITGPEALKFPERGVGVDRYREQLQRLTQPSVRLDAQEEQQRAARADEVTATLRQLAELRDSGMITPEEYEAKKAEVLTRL